jgi:hypothetical protein
MGDDEEIERQRVGLEEVLRLVKDALVDNGWTDIVVRRWLGIFERKRTHNEDGTPFVASEDGEPE